MFASVTMNALRSRRTDKKNSKHLRKTGTTKNCLLPSLRSPGLCRTVILDASTMQTIASNSWNRVEQERIPPHTAPAQRLEKYNGKNRQKTRQKSHESFTNRAGGTHNFCFKKLPKLSDLRRLLPARRCY